MPGLDGTDGAELRRPPRLLVLAPVFRFALVVLSIWLALFVLLKLVPNAAGDPLALQLPLDRLSVTVPLVAMAGVLALLLGGGIGLLAARLRGKAERLLERFATVLSYLPAFWLGLLLMLALTGILPTGGFIPWSAGPLQALASLVLPALALGISHAGLFALNVHHVFGDEPGDAEVRPLRMGGLADSQGRWILGYGRVLKQLPRLLGRLFASVLVGTVVVENLFYLPGLGRQVLGAALEHDLAGVRAGLFALLALAALIMLLAELGRLALVALPRNSP